MYIVVNAGVGYGVTPTVSGHHIILTYNAVLSEKADSIPKHLRNSVRFQLRGMIDKILDDRHFLPKGGHLGFKLVHDYEVSPHYINNIITKMRVDKLLKGQDAGFLAACQAVGLDPQLWTFVVMGDKKLYMHRYVNDFMTILGDGCGEHNDEKALRAVVDFSSGLRVEERDLEDASYFEEIVPSDSEDSDSQICLTSRIAENHNFQGE